MTILETMESIDQLLVEVKHHCPQVDPTRERTRTYVGRIAVRTVDQQHNSPYMIVKTESLTVTNRHITASGNIESTTDTLPPVDVIFDPAHPLYELAVVESDVVTDIPVPR